MLFREQVEHTVRPQACGYQLLRWLEKALAAGFISPEAAGAYATSEDAAYAWLDKHYSRVAGAASLALSATFAWTAQGSPKKGFVLVADDIMAAQKVLTQRLRGPGDESAVRPKRWFSKNGCPQGHATPTRGGSRGGPFLQGHPPSLIEPPALVGWHRTGA